MSELLTDKEIEQDLKEAQVKFMEICHACTIYLNINGLKLDAVRDILHTSLDECVDRIEQHNLTDQIRELDK